MSRDYKKEYRDFHGKPAEIAKRSERNSARAQVAKRVGKAAIAGKDVDHKTPLRKGGGNGVGNLRVKSVSANRSWRAGKKGYD